MHTFSEQQKSSLGVTYVMGLLSMATSFGRDLSRRLSPFTRGQELELEKELENVSRASAALCTDTSRFNGLTHTLSKFRDIRGSIHALGEHRTLSEVELFEIKAFLLNLTELAERFTVFNTSAGLSGIEICAMDDALDILDADGTRLRSFHLCESYSTLLGQIRKEKHALESQINAETDNTRYQELMLARTAITVREEDEERRVREELTMRLSQHKTAFDSTIDAVARLDFTLAKAALAAKERCVKPLITQNTIDLLDMRDPETDAALRARGGCMTPVSLRLSPGVCVLTGVNMGGKTVGLRSLLLNAYLFQCGFLVFAAKASLPMFDHIDFILEDKQSISAGLSSFGAEITELSGIISRAKTSFSLIVLDEPARGTNPAEGRAIAAGLAAYLNALPSISVMSTHYDNVARPEYNLYTTAGLKKELIKDGVFRPDMLRGLMDYRLVKPRQDGGGRNALTVCRLLGLDDELLDIISGYL